MVEIKKEKKIRNEYIDIVRGVLITLVIIGHCIQCGNGPDYLINQQYFENLVFKIIYSFHMPLFMLISGYLFSLTTTKKSSLQIIRNLFSTLVVPIIAWSLVNFLIFMSTNSEYGGFILLTKQYISVFLGTLWFLWAILFCSFSVLVGKFLLNDSLLYYFLLPFIFFVTPDGYNLVFFKFLYPFFVVGYLWEKYRIMSMFLLTRFRKLIVISILLLFFVILMQFFDYDTYIYTSGVSIINKTNIGEQMIDNLLRWAIGFIGSGLILILVKLIGDNITNFKSTFIFKVLTSLGRHSLGIYVVNIYVSNFLLTKIIPTVDNSFLIIGVEIVSVLVFCFYTSILMSKSKILRTFLLGGR